MFIKLFNKLLFTFIFCVIAFTVKAKFFIAADIDLQYKTNFIENGYFEVDNMGFSARKIFADKFGDRILVSVLIDFMDNFSETMLDQMYLQYKGDLGKWNITIGRYNLPFGLLPNYRTNRLLINTLEYHTIGIESDNGILVSGIISNFDYALSFSQGIGMQRWLDSRNSILTVVRIGWQGEDFEDLRVGLSGVLGEVSAEHSHDEEKNGILYKRLIVLDLIKYIESAVWRSEVSFGDENNRIIMAIYTGIDYTILSELELNLAYKYFIKNHSEINSFNIGITYNFLGFQARAAQKISLTAEEKNELSFQIYRIFNYSF